MLPPPCAAPITQVNPYTMTTYLSGGWYRAGGGRSLRTEVLDGAVDAAGMLHRAGVSAERVTLIALKARSWLTLIDPRMAGIAILAAEQRERLLDQLVQHCDIAPELHSFVADCVEHIASTADVMAFYLHLMHVARMLKLLAHAELARSAMAMLAQTKPPAAATKPRTAATKPRAAATKPRAAAGKKSQVRSPGGRSRRRR